MNTQEAPSWPALDSYLAGNATPSEQREIDKWAALNPQNSLELEVLRQGLVSNYKAADATPGDINRISDSIIRLRDTRPARRVPYMRYVTAGCLLILGFVGARQLLKRLPGNTQPKILTYATQTGQRASFTLPDGSRLTLAPASTVEVQGRKVKLLGEAVFTVTQHSGDPFIVEAGGVETRVLGTVFGIRTYNGLRVAVAEGKVAVSSAVLTAGDIATISDQKELEVTRGVDVSAMLAWTTGRLEFRETPVSEVMAQLTSWYGLEFRSSPKLMQRRITGALDNASAETAIELLRVLLNANAKRSGNTITFVEQL